MRNSASVLPAIISCSLAFTICFGFAYVYLRSPEIEGVVLDAATGEPVPDAIVLKAVDGPAFVLYSESPNPRSGGAEAKVVTSQDGHFEFPAKWIAPWPPKGIDTIDIRVWHKDYIGIISRKHGTGWTSDIPSFTGGYCRIDRRRRWPGKLIYSIYLGRPMTEQQWQTKIGSTNLGMDQSAEQERLFSDFIGYLERWPDGERAGEYYRCIWTTAALGSCDYLRDQVAKGRWSVDYVRTLCDRSERILSVAGRMRTAPNGMGEEAFKEGLREHERDWLCAKELLDGR